MSALRILAHPRTWATYGIGEPNRHHDFPKYTRLQVVGWDSTGRALVVPGGSDEAMRASEFESVKGPTELLYVRVVTKTIHEHYLAGTAP